ncbi:MAG: hypothetical protein GY841_16130 [FCB group bacterium]|nr:hypothetical protein [FCB group bacterium]
MATNISEWYRKIGIADVPYPVMKEALIETLRDFCRETGLWTVAITAISLVDGTSEYALTATQGDIAGVDHVELNNNPLDPTSVEYLNENRYGWRGEGESEPTHYYVDSSRNLNTYPTPAADDASALAVWPVIMPTESATTVEDFLWDDHWQVITWGAREKLYDIPSAPWFDPNLSEHYREKYEDGRDKAATIKETDYSVMQSSFLLRPR